LAGQFFARDDDKFKVCRVTKSSNVFTVRAANISVGTYTVISFNGQGWSLSTSWKERNSRWKGSSI
ncbi:hypothetical protein L917_16622, partial [Phytophthora nicotianae]